MFIRDFSWRHEVGTRPEAELTISDINEAELLSLRYLAANGDKIKIESKEYSKPSANDMRVAIETIMDGLTEGRMAEMFKIRFVDIKVKKVIFNKPATIVFWSDGTKTVVKCGEGDVYEKEKGFFIACSKKLFGNDYKAVGQMNKALAMAEDKNEVNDEIRKM